MNKRYTFPAILSFVFLFFTASSYASLITSNQQDESVVWTIVQSGFPVEKVVLRVAGPHSTTSNCIAASDCSLEFPPGASPTFNTLDLTPGRYSWIVEIIVETSSCDQAASRELQAGLQGLVDASIQTYLNCLASLNFPDSVDLKASGTFLVTAAGALVAPPGPDLTQPFSLVAPANLSVEANAVLTAVVIGDASATTVHPPVTITNNAPLTDYPLGDTIIKWTGIDGLGEIAVDTQLITIVDTTPPVITIPADMTEEATAILTPVDIGLATATDIFPVTIVSDAPASYQLGTTVVIWTATDTSGNSTSGSQNITIVDTTPPAFDFTQHESELNPPNHKMVLVAIVDNISDLVDPGPVVSIVVISNQPINGTGDGSTEIDWEVMPDGDSWLIYLRAERSGNLGTRLYDIAVTVTDFSGYVSTAAGVVTVPHSNGKNK